MDRQGSGFGRTLRGDLSTIDVRTLFIMHHSRAHSHAIAIQPGGCQGYTHRTNLFFLYIILTCQALIAGRAADSPPREHNRSTLLSVCRVSTFSPFLPLRHAQPGLGPRL